MKLYTTKQITGTIPGVTTRTLIDLVEKHVIVPAHDPKGQGAHRLYSRENLLEIMFAMAVRGMFKPFMITRLLAVLKIYKDEPITYVGFTFRDRSKVDETPVITYFHESETLHMSDLKIGFNKVNDRMKEKGLNNNWVDRYATTYVNLAELKGFVDKNF